MAHDAFTAPDRPSLFRIAYASRVIGCPDRADIVRLAASAAVRNLRLGISGVMLHHDGVFLQWLEGADADVERLMNRIALDPRHHDLTILGSGSVGERRYANWPMHLDGRSFRPTMAGGSAASASDPLCHHAMAAALFDELAAEHSRERAEQRAQRPPAPDMASDIAADDRFLRALMDGGRVEFPTAACANLRQRAALVDDACRQLADGWHDDRWTVVDVGLAMAELNHLWQQAGRVREPDSARFTIDLVVPPGSSEVLGAIVKADLMRAAGLSVRQILEPDLAALDAALLEDDPSPILVAGPRIGMNGDGARAEALADRLQRRLPHRAVHLGGRAAGPLVDWSRHFATHPVNGSALAAAPQSAVHWLVRTAIGTMVGAQRRPPAGAGC